MLKIVERIAVVAVAFLLLTVAARSHRYQERQNRAPGAMAQLAAHAWQAMTMAPGAAVAISAKREAAVESVSSR